MICFHRIGDKNTNCDHDHLETTKDIDIKCTVFTFSIYRVAMAMYQISFELNNWKYKRIHFKSQELLNSVQLCTSSDVRILPFKTIGDQFKKDFRLHYKNWRNIYDKLQNVPVSAKLYVSYAQNQTYQNAIELIWNFWNY